MYTCISDYYAVHMMSSSRYYTMAMGDRPTFHAMHASCSTKLNTVVTTMIVEINEIQCDKIHNTGYGDTQKHTSEFFDVSAGRKK